MDDTTPTAKAPPYLYREHTEQSLQQQTPEARAAYAEELTRDFWERIAIAAAARRDLSALEITVIADRCADRWRRRFTGEPANRETLTDVIHLQSHTEDLRPRPFCATQDPNALIAIQPESVTCIDCLRAGLSQFCGIEGVR